eukprot:CAMPEP_0169118076 /NCGR_PEP_ID=MMETSP1015-20121227/30804_1 /TAXON_ID=342587 /ORGANISM="Karlodinium micrum, Strain CCMP2283" /LENGTH=134 /DNA_ID=CAMNT_0009180813 /DNA_START=588 /DNA_END=993 /DNA_ORIENTATION=-
MAELVSLALSGCARQTAEGDGSASALPARISVAANRRSHHPHVSERIGWRRRAVMEAALHMEDEATVVDVEIDPHRASAGGTPRITTRCDAGCKRSIPTCVAKRGAARARKIDCTTKCTNNLEADCALNFFCNH